MSIKYTITQSRLLYVLTISDRKHANLLKVGEVFVDNEVADNPNKQVLFKAVRDVLDKRSYMQGVTYHIEHVECTTYAQETKCYKADDVYRTLAAMNVPQQSLNRYKGDDADIWFACNIDKVHEAIKKIKNGQGAGFGTIKFRPEQDKAITETVSHFSKQNGKAFLWNAKMRFGKTLSGLEVAKQMDYKSTLIITHRPVVDKGWHEDFHKIFGDQEDIYSYATRMSDEDSTGEDFYSLKKKVDAGKKRMVFFVSMQYLRLSQFVGGKERNFDPLKKAIMEYDWDFVMVDEAHEGIEAAAGVRVMSKLKKENTRILSLSGTPFNLLDKYDEGEIYTWDYVMEQRAKQEWDDKHFGDPNPYAELPRMQILTFTLPKMVRDEAIENNEVFKFHEFFRVWTEEDKKIYQRLIDNEKNALKRVELQTKMAEIKVDKFIHEGAVRRFLDKLVEESETSQYPFSTDEFREHFRHTFWLLPGVKEAAALYDLLKEHEVFGEDNDMFHIVNVAGDGNIEDKDGSALKEVQDAIKKYEYTITLSCGKLTTGVSVPEWTAVLCMKGSENTPAANYMQTIFRVQTHAVLNGRQKSDCYVFDFAPDRALTAVAETAKMAVDAQGAGKKQMKRKQKEEEEHLQAFIKLCPVLSMDEGEMGKKFSANQIFEKLSNVYIERAVRSGYADNSIYNPDQLLNLTPEQEKALGDVHDLLGSMPAGWKPEKININNTGIGDTNNAEMIKYIYFLTAKNEIPPLPVMSAESDDNGCPMTDTAGWDDKMCYPTQIFPYLFVSNSRFIDGEWTDFSKPVIWKEWTDPDKDTDEAKKKRDQENKEKRARMSVLRGVAIRIPLLVYGAEINDDDGEEITIDNFASEEIVDQASWDEFMPKGFTKETFNILKDCFDRSIFTGAAKRIRQMVKEADNLNTEDRIAKIATIFSYFHNPDKETVLTPWKVVNRHMSDCLGGWCFWNEEFDAEYTVENQYGENIKAARYVERGSVTQDIFGDYNARILEINSKTGLYPLYMAYSLFKTSKEKAFRENELTGERGTSTDSEGYYRQAGNDLEIWKDVLQDNIFVVCRTKMAVSITKRTLAGFRKDIRMNVKCYSKKIEVNDLVSAGVLKRDTEGMTKQGNTFCFNGESKLDCDMITVLRAKSEAFRKDIVQGVDFWHVYNSIPKNANEDINNMNFKAIVGNPPYQIMDGGGAGAAATPIYNHFVTIAKNLNPNYVSMIIPARWYAGGRGLDDFRVDMLTDKRLEVIVDFPSEKDCFPTANISGGICYFRWNKDSKEEKCQFINVIKNKRVSAQRDLNAHESFLRYNEAVSIIDKISAISKTSMSSIIAPYMPFGLRSYERGTALPESPTDVLMHHSKGTGYVSRDMIKACFEYVDKYNVIIGKAISGHLGETDENGQVKLLATTKIINPGEVVSESYLAIGIFDSYSEANACYKYVISRFARFLLLQGLTSMNITNERFLFVPLQDFTKGSDIDWSSSVSEIDKQLYKKYGLADNEISFIESMIKPME